MSSRILARLTQGRSRSGESTTPALKHPKKRLFDTSAPLQALGNGFVTRF
jgi:hypothetical protein